MHSPAEPDPLRSCPGRPGPPSPARVEHAFDGLRFGVSRGIARACVSYLRAYRSRRRALTSRPLARLYRVHTPRPYVSRYRVYTCRLSLSLVPLWLSPIDVSVVSALPSRVPGFCVCDTPMEWLVFNGFRYRLVTPSWGCYSENYRKEAGHGKPHRYTPSGSRLPPLNPLNQESRYIKWKQT